jgi:hypothetical protein
MSSHIVWTEFVDADRLPERFEGEGFVFSSLTITWDDEVETLPWIVESSTLGDGSSLYHRFRFIHAAKQYAAAQDLREYAELLSYTALLDEHPITKIKGTN